MRVSHLPMLLMLAGCGGGTADAGTAQPTEPPALPDARAREEDEDETGDEPTDSEEETDDAPTEDVGDSPTEDIADSPTEDVEDEPTEDTADGPTEDIAGAAPPAPEEERWPEMKPLPEEDPNTPAPGWEAIAAHLRTIYPEAEPHHLGTMLKHRLGGPDPIDGTDIYTAPDGSHWHYITYGMSELYEPDPEHPRFGFELTFRLARPSDWPEERPPPQWPIGLMNNLGRYVFGSGNAFASGQNMPMNGPIARHRPDTPLRALLFADDPILGTIETPNGPLAFVQLVGVSDSELELAKDWDADRFLRLLTERIPLLLTDLEREDLSLDVELQAACEEGASEDGSTEPSSYLDELSWERQGNGLVITIGAVAVRALKRMGRLRLPFERPYALFGQAQSVLFAPGGPGLSLGEEGMVRVALTEEQARGLAAAVEERRGRYPIPGFDGVFIDVLPSIIRNPDGSVHAVLGE